MRPVYLHIPHTPEIGVREILKQYYGPANVLDRNEEGEAEFLVNEPDTFGDYLAFAGPFRVDDFQNFLHTDVAMFSVICDPVIRAWLEFQSEPRRNTFEHWLKYDSVPNTVCYRLTGYKQANAADLQTFVRMANFMVCNFEKAPDMLNALGRLHGWYPTQFLNCPRSFSLSETPLETPEMPGTARELVQTYHNADCQFYRWLSTRVYIF